MIKLPTAEELESEFSELLAAASTRAKFALMSTHLAAAREAAEILEKEGPVTYDSRDLATKHPAAQVYRDHAAAFGKLLAHFENELKYLHSPLASLTD